MSKLLEKLEKLIADRRTTRDALERNTGLPRGRFSRWKSGIGEPTASQV